MLTCNINGFFLHRWRALPKTFVPFLMFMFTFNSFSFTFCSKLHAVIDCLFFVNLSSFMHCAVVLSSEYCCTLWKTSDMIRPYHRRGSQSGCRNLSLKIFNQNQLEGVLVYMTFSLSFTSLEDSRHSQSISHKFGSEYVRETTVH